MKKRFLALTMALAMVLGFAACGNKASQSGSSAPADRKSAKEESTQNKSGQGSQKDSKLAEWYNSEDRTTLEDIINQTFKDQGLAFSVTIEEPDTIVYNYQYTEQLDASEEFKTQLEKGLDASAPTIIADIANYRNLYELPLETIRLVYLNADGSVILSMDITEDYESSAASLEPSGDFTDLETWMQSEEARKTIEVTNNLLASSGMTVDFSADGNTFIYEYYVSADTFRQLGLDAYSDDELNDFVNQVVESQSSSLDTLFDNFENGYGIALDGIRVVFYTEDGTEFGSADIENE